MYLNSYINLVFFFFLDIVGEAESVEFSLTEKKVTVTLNRRHDPRTAKMPENELQNNGIYKNNPSNKFSLVKRMFSSSSS